MSAPKCSEEYRMCGDVSSEGAQNLIERFITNEPSNTFDMVCIVFMSHGLSARKGAEIYFSGMFRKFLNCILPYI